MKKFSSYELEGFAKIAVKQFLENKVPLNDSIEKIARDNDFNFSQTERVVEESNTGAYIHMFNKAQPSERYIEFPVASTKEIWPKINPEDNTMKTSHYALPPDKILLNVSSKQKDEFNKFASAHDEESFEGPESQSHADTLKRIHERALEERIKNAQLELELAIDRVISNITKEARQSILSGDSTNSEINFAVKHALDSKYEKIATYILSQLPKTQSKEKVAGVLDTNHEFYQNLKKLGELVDTYIEAHKNPQGSLDKIASAMKWVFIVPAAGFTAAALGGAYKAGKIHGEATTSISQDPSLYMKPR